MKASSNFGLIGGGGFRAQAYLRIAQALPEKFRIGGLVVRNEEEGRLIEQKWQVPTYRTVELLLEKEQLDFVVVSVSKETCADILIQLAQRGIPALAETPPAADLPGLLRLHEQLTQLGARVQVAEQYQFQPMHAARISLVQAGRIGEAAEATVSISQTYHAVSLMRKLLSVGFEEAKIRAMSFQTSMVAGPNRQGIPMREEMMTAPRDMAWLDFGGKLGIYDFTKDQHRSWIRSNHLSVRGQRGEIFNHRLSMLADFQTPLHLELKRINKGEEENLEGYYMQGIMAGESWVYRNPFIPARLYDDEIAIATCLQLMAEYVAGGAEFYSFAEAAQDHYLGMMIEKAMASGEQVTAARQPWAK